MKTVVAMTTLYRTATDERRRDLALQTIRSLTDHGFEVAVVDGGSPSEFVDRVSAIGANVFAEAGPTMGAGRRQALREAAAMSGPQGNVAWMEPEKLNLVPALGHVVDQMARCSADAAVPNRAGGFISLPESQRHAESYGNFTYNQLFGEVVGEPLDWWFGPRVIGPRGLAAFLQYDGRFGDTYDSIFAPLVLAASSGLLVISVDIEGYVYEQPWEGSDVVLTLKRERQLHNLVPSGEALARELGIL